jgi:hypothetical protein
MSTTETDLGAFDHEPEGDQGTPPEGGGTFDPIEFGARVRALPDGPAHDAAWSELSPEDRDRAIVAGAFPPANLPDDSTFRRSPNFDPEAGRTQLEAIASKVRRGDVRLTDEARAAFDGFYDQADRLPNDHAGELIERALWIARNAEAEAFSAAPFGFVVRRHTERTRTGWKTTEHDSAGRSRVVAEGTEAELEASRAAQAESNALPKDPGSVKLADVASWPIERKLAFADANPDEWEGLKRSEGEVRDEQHQAAGW